MKRTSQALGLIAILIGVPGCASTYERELAEWESLKRQAADILRVHRDPDSLAATALLSARSAPAEAVTLISDAVAAAPDRPELVMLQIQICTEADGCDPKPMEMRLRVLDPANASGWFGDVARAFEADDQSTLDMALAAAGQASRADTYYTVLASRLGKAALDAGTDASMAPIGELAGLGMSQYIAVAKGCGLARLDRPGVRETCRSLAAALMAGDNFLVEMIGVAIAKRAWPTDSPQWQAASEARRTYRYRSEALMETLSGELNEAWLRAYYELVGQHRREQDAMVAQLVAAGIDPTPPADWVDEESP